MGRRSAVAMSQLRSISVRTKRARRFGSRSRAAATPARESAGMSMASRASTMAGMSRQATISHRATSATAHELGQQRHAVAGLQLGVEIVGHAEHGVVDEDLDVLAQLPAVPEGVVELGEPAAERLEQRADGGT